MSLSFGTAIIGWKQGDLVFVPQSPLVHVAVQLAAPVPVASEAMCVAHQRLRRRRAWMATEGWWQGQQCRCAWARVIAPLEEKPQTAPNQAGCRC